MQYDDVRIDGEVCFALDSDDSVINQAYTELAKELKEKFFLFKIDKRLNKNESLFYLIGKDYQKSFEMKSDLRNIEKAKAVMRGYVDEGLK
jgi:hypothetical protein